MTWKRLALAGSVLALVVCLSAGQLRAAERAENTCVQCHLLLADNLKAPAEAFENDVHNQARLGCAACHGGDPGAEQAQDSMDPAKGFRGVPKALEIPELCGSCHANAAFIKQFVPNLPTDQLAQYWTSVHGHKIKAGDTGAATCVSCHGTHGILSVHDTRSPVYPTHVADTCAVCHTDEQRMARYGIPATQVAEYKQSVHYRALTTGGDISAPGCATCHGAHGATPPGVQSIAYVCGTCHSRNLDMFRASPHQVAFENLSAGACAACHGNHRVLPPDDSWLAVAGEGVCGRCHTAQDPGGAAAIGILATLRLAQRTMSDAREQVTRAERAGMLMDEAEAVLQQAHQEIITARTEVHRASVAAVASHAEAAIKAAEQALASARQAFNDIRYRRIGLLVALTLVVLALIAVVLTIRQIERPVLPSEQVRRDPGT